MALALTTAGCVAFFWGISYVDGLFAKGHQEPEEKSISKQMMGHHGKH